MESGKRNSGELMECSKKKFWNLIRPRINCSIIGMDAFFEVPNELAECETDSSAARTFLEFKNLTEYFKGRMWKLGCPIPCLQISYTFSQVWKAKPLY